MTGAPLPPFYDQRVVVDVEGTYLPHPEDDLVALLRSVYAMYVIDCPYDDLEHVMCLSSLWRGAL